MFVNRTLFISYSVFTCSGEKGSVSFANAWWLAAGAVTDKESAIYKHLRTCEHLGFIYNLLKLPDTLNKITTPNDVHQQGLCNQCSPE